MTSDAPNTETKNHTDVREVMAHMRNRLSATLWSGEVIAGETDRAQHKLKPEFKGLVRNDILIHQ